MTLAGARDPIPIVYRTPVPSAQIKSAVLLAGPRRARRHHGDRERGEPRPHRAHARAISAPRCTVVPEGEHGRRITLHGPARADARRRSWCRPIRRRPRFRWWRR